MLNLIKENYIFSVIRAKNENDAIKIAEASIKGGIKNIEITYTTPNASEVIKSLSEKFSQNPDVVIGAGTVMNPEIAKKAINAGSKFLVSPHFSNSIQKIALENSLLYFPGCATVTEIVTALESGVKLVKLFPGGSLGPGFIKDVHGPLPGIDLMPSGGVSLENIANWKAAGACAVGVGSALTTVFEQKGQDGVVEMAAKFINALKG